MCFILDLTCLSIFLITSERIELAEIALKRSAFPNYIWIYLYLPSTILFLVHILEETSSASFLFSVLVRTSSPSVPPGALPKKPSRLEIDMFISLAKTAFP